MKCLFFIQPDATYNYPKELYRSELPKEFLRRSTEERPRFYERMRARREVIYLGDLFEAWGPDRKAIVDDLHYSPGFNEFLAQHVADHIEIEALSPRPSVVDESLRTGSYRG